jgi:hypothetical protein
VAGTYGQPEGTLHRDAFPVRKASATVGAPTTLTPEQRTLRARAAAYTRWSREDTKPNAERGQAGLRAKFRRQIEADHPELPAAELDRRAECAYRAHFTKLALASSKARSSRSRTG